jgi:hypothetical protein
VAFGPRKAEFLLFKLKIGVAVSCSSFEALDILFMIVLGVEGAVVN